MRSFSNISMEQKIIIISICLSIITAYEYHTEHILHGSGMKMFPNGSYRNIRVAHFINCNFAELKPYTFGGFDNIEKIILRHDNISYIHPKAFAKAFKVKQLDLFDNRLNVLHEATFIDLMFLQDLNLGNNTIRSIDEKVIKPMWFLKSLDLSYNSITILNKTFLKHSLLLEELNLNGNPLKFSQKGGILSSSALTQLYLQSCNLEELPADAFSDLPNLEAIDLSRNRFRVLPETLLNHIVNLKYLDISFNLITNLDVSMFYVPTILDVVYCDGNPLKNNIDCAQLLVTLHSEYKYKHLIQDETNEIKTESKGVLKQSVNSNKSSSAEEVNQTIIEERVSEEDLEDIEESGDREVKLDDTHDGYSDEYFHFEETKDDFNNIENVYQKEDGRTLVGYQKDVEEKIITTNRIICNVVTFICATALILVILMIGQIYYLLAQSNNGNKYKRFNA